MSTPPEAVARLRALNAAYDETSLVVYQAYPAQLGKDLLALGRFGGAWRFDRHTKIQASWVGTVQRYASGDRPDREFIAAIRVLRTGFDAMLIAALQVDFDPKLYQSKHSWRLATRFSPVLVEWEPDGPNAADPQSPRFRLHGPLVRRFAEEWVIGIEDVSSRFLDPGALENLVRLEKPYPVPPEVRLRIGLR